MISPSPVSGALGVIGLSGRVCQMKVNMKALIIQDDKKVEDDIFHAFQICLPEVELICTNLGEKGIELGKSVPVDVVIIDMNIPDISGFDILKQIRHYSQVPVIILSFSRDEADIVKSLELGADEYVVKPFRQLEFMAHVRALLRKKITPQERNDYLVVEKI